MTLPHLLYINTIALFLESKSRHFKEYWQSEIWKLIWICFFFQATHCVTNSTERCKRTRSENQGCCNLAKWFVCERIRKLHRLWKTWKGKGPSINYIVSKLAIFDPLSDFVVFLLSKIGDFEPHYRGVIVYGRPLTWYEVLSPIRIPVLVLNQFLVCT